MNLSMRLLSDDTRDKDVINVYQKDSNLPNSFKIYLVKICTIIVFRPSFILNIKYISFVFTLFPLLGVCL